VPIAKPRTLGTLASTEYARFTHTLWSCLMEMEGVESSNVMSVRA
jgi:hypothetical protein